MATRITRSELKRLIEAEAWSELVQRVQRLHPADLAAHASGLSTEHLQQLLEALPPEPSAALFADLPPAFQRRQIEGFTDVELRALLGRLATEDRARFVSALTPPQAEALLSKMDAELRTETEDLLGWPPEAVGRRMQTRVLAFPGTTTVRQGLEQLRDASQMGRWQGDVIFIVDKRHRLMGQIELKQLLLAEAEENLGNIAQTVRQTVAATLPIRELPPLVRHYDLEFVPVVNLEQRLIGLITNEEIMDSAQEETTTQLQRSAGVGRIGDRVSHARPSLLYRKRVGWLLVLVLSGFGTSALLADAGMTAADWLPLILFLPLIIDSAGNAGTQSALLTIRGLATGEIGLRDWRKLWQRELLVALALGLSLALPAAMIGLWRADPMIALIVLISLPLCVLFGSLIGVLLPLALARLGIDPAYGSAPLITTLADVVGLALFLGLASQLL